MTAACLRDSQTMTSRTIGATTIPDVDFYQRVIDRVRGGEKYHDAAHAELASPGNPPKSLFNWRIPTCAWAMAALPSADWATWLLRGFALLSVLLAAKALLGDMPLFGVVAGLVLLMGGAFAWSVIEPAASITSEPWCEVLILLSLSAYARDRHWLGMVLALSALALRELALPYCVVAAGLSCWQLRRREVVGWVVGFAALGAFLAWHAAEVADRQHDVSSVAVGQWQYYDGFGFTLLASTMNVLLQSLPNWLVAVAVPLALLSLAGWRGPVGGMIAATAGLYFTAYLFAHGGEYWGFCHTPLIVLGFVRAPAACRDLVRAAAGARRTAAT